MAGTLRYTPDQDQIALVEGVADAVIALLPIARLHQATDGEDAAVWAALTDLGLLAAGLPEEEGGTGLSMVEQALIAVVFGRTLASPAVLATMASVPSAAALDRGANRIAAGVSIGGVTIWADEPDADLLLVEQVGRFALHALPTDAPVRDNATWGSRLRSAQDQAPLLSLDEAASCRIRLIFAGALAGIATATLEMAVEYAKVREQFGRPIGSFQAVKHHCANMAIAARSARDALDFAAVASADGRANAAYLTECAFLTAGKAAVANAGLNIQVHGGIGFSDEADPHLFLKRAQLLVALGGGLEPAVDRIAASGGDPLATAA